jgi:hypothetical protein
MLHWIFVPLASWFQGFNLFRYITFRAAFAAILAFLVVVVCSPGILGWLRQRRMQGCTDRPRPSGRCESKQSVPTMGARHPLAVAVRRCSSSSSTTSAWSSRSSRSSPSARSALDDSGRSRAPAGGAVGRRKLLGGGVR